MIGYLNGRLIPLGDSALLITQGGVGYRVWVSNQVLQKGEQASLALYTHTYVREDRLELYGFVNLEQLQLFELLIGVSGCGPKTALMLVSGGVSAFQQAIKQANLAYLTSFPRVGKKLAQKLVIELKSKLDGFGSALDLVTNTAYQDAQEALVTLGFSQEKIATVLATLAPQNLATADLIKAALKSLHQSDFS